MNKVSHAFIERVANTVFSEARTRLIETNLGKWSSIPACFSEYKLLIRCPDGQVPSCLLFPVDSDEPVDAAELISSWKAHKCAIVEVRVTGAYYGKYRGLPADPEHVSALISQGSRRTEFMKLTTTSHDITKAPDILSILDSIISVGHFSYMGGGQVCLSYLRRWAQQGIASLNVCTHDRVFLNREFERIVLKLLFRRQLSFLYVKYHKFCTEEYKRMLRYAIYSTRNMKYTTFCVRPEFARIILNFTRTMTLCTQYDLSYFSDPFRYRVRDANGNLVAVNFVMYHHREDTWELLYESK